MEVTSDICQVLHGRIDPPRPRGRPPLTPEQKEQRKLQIIDYRKQYYVNHKDKFSARYIPSNYINSCIYRVFSPETDRFYIGSTSRPLEHRLAEHKRCILRRANPLYQTMADLSLVWQIEPLVELEAESREYLEQLELLYIAQASINGKVLNTNKKYTADGLRALKQVMGILKEMKTEHLPAIFKVA